MRTAIKAVGVLVCLLGMTVGAGLAYGVDTEKIPWYRQAMEIGRASCRERV